jgi:hypothetical protein
MRNRNNRPFYIPDRKTMMKINITIKANEYFFKICRDLTNEIINEAMAFTKKAHGVYPNIHAIRLAREKISGIGIGIGVDDL